MTRGQLKIWKKLSRGELIDIIHDITKENSNKKDNNNSTITKNDLSDNEKNLFL